MWNEDCELELEKAYESAELALLGAGAVYTGGQAVVRTGARAAQVAVGTTAIAAGYTGKAIGATGKAVGNAAEFGVKAAVAGSIINNGVINARNDRRDRLSRNASRVQKGGSFARDVYRRYTYADELDEF